jgi:hypothetical protein
MQTWPGHRSTGVRARDWGWQAFEKLSVALAISGAVGPVFDTSTTARLADVQTCRPSFSIHTVGGRGARSRRAHEDVANSDAVNSPATGDSDVLTPEPSVPFLFNPRYTIA